LRRRKIPGVHPQIATAKAHHHVAVPREATPRDPAQSQPSETRKQLVRVTRRGVEVECELRRVGFAKPEDGPQRMLFTDDGRPPRERLLIVPDVEMIVPRFVCSM
jgi:hypothetical protein